jgi:hypothetical protein
MLCSMYGTRQGHLAHWSPSERRHLAPPTSRTKGLKPHVRGGSKLSSSTTTVPRPLAEGMPETIADRLLDLERYFREGRASRITDDIKRVTGQEPRRLAEYVREAAATGVWDIGVEHVSR